jgi:hypothetical protein
MAVWRRERRRWVAILAAYALVLQALLAGLGAGTAAAAPAPVLDAFGGVICATDGAGGHEVPGVPPAHHRDLDCLAHCALALGAALPAATAPALAAPLAWHLAAPLRPRPAAVPGAPAIGPLGPRGPPV